MYPPTIFGAFNLAELYTEWPTASFVLSDMVFSTAEFLRAVKPVWGWTWVKYSAESVLHKRGYTNGKQMGSHISMIAFVKWSWWWVLDNVSLTFWCAHSPHIPFSQVELWIIYCVTVELCASLFKKRSLSTKLSTCHFYTTNYFFRRKRSQRYYYKFQIQ